MRDVQDVQSPRHLSPTAWTAPAEEMENAPFVDKT